MLWNIDYNAIEKTQEEDKEYQILVEIRWVLNKVFKECLDEKVTFERWRGEVGSELSRSLGEDSFGHVEEQTKFLRQEYN